jgi:hypothetical protein
VCGSGALQAGITVIAGGSAITVIAACVLKDLQRSSTSRYNSNNGALQAAIM